MAATMAPSMTTEARVTRCSNPIMARLPSDDPPHSSTWRGSLLAGLLTLSALLPLRVAHTLGALVGRVAAAVPNRQRRVARCNLARCLPTLGRSERERLLRASFRESGQGLMELGWFWRRPRQEVLGLVRAVHGLGVLEAALASPGGMILAAPHLGAWELLCQYLVARAPLTVLYREARDPGVDRVIAAGRARFGAELVCAGPLAVRRLYRALGAGRIVGILPDQQPKRGQGEFAPFFGVPALTMVLLSRLAHRSGCPVVFGWAERLPRARGFDLHFEAAPATIGDPDTALSVAALNATVERLVRRCPSQYQWGYKRFSLQPDGAAFGY